MQITAPHSIDLFHILFSWPIILTAYLGTVLVYVDARRRGLRAKSWAVVTFLAGPLALTVLVVYWMHTRERTGPFDPIGRQGEP
ncbi:MULTISPECIES: hypothetical protein [Halomicrobium]|uniref:Uncharacterized protein n=2 Tax=Halomicrobium mukohataei TaxID=57705 RepID=C7P1X2_HALMD|nr:MULTISPECIES: hypothetical protein [Halomicrobium]ACV49212.1 hypothetical protein Hmuk_3107 [Halomicrobium mukohataei DSM 12286]QCD64617.1 hypothetical protein E5139_02780 [Halomicrobium mukohataei]QFR19424.1 hypothetical protein GBQ70_02780 [Halomicrobium sp. ZPS1]